MQACKPLLANTCKCTTLHTPPQSWGPRWCDMSPSQKTVQVYATFAAYCLLTQSELTVKSNWAMPVISECGRWRKLCLPASCVLMAHPRQASKPQGLYIVKWRVLVDNVSGTDRGWQQSRSNWTLLAVAGPWARAHVVRASSNHFLLSLLTLMQKHQGVFFWDSCKTEKQLDSLRGSSVKIGTIQRRLAWPLRKDDTQNREAFHIFCIS